MSYEHCSVWTGSRSETVPRFGSCTDCGSALMFYVWGEGIDAGIACTGCNNKVIIR